jgi:site-specific DNA recombinase
MISWFNKLNIEPQAVDQPLDLSVPENKMMLAFYLASPEVENDRRSINVINGLRRARKEGRCTTSAPIGYKNVREEDGRASIVAGKYADLIKEGFEELAKGIYTQKEVYLSLKRKGLKCCLNNFMLAIRNPIYAGRIVVPAYKDEEETLVKGLHEPLISQELFNDVQDVLKGRRKKHPQHVTRRDELPLRGFLECKKCGRKLTGSASRGNGGKYFYYHCSKGCNERFKAEEANTTFIKELRKIRLQSQWLEVYFQVLKDEFNNNKEDNQKNVQKVEAEIKKYEQRLNNAQTLMLDGEIDAREYRSIKGKYEEILNNLKAEKLNLELVEDDFLKYMEWNVSFLKSLDKSYESASLPIKQQIIGSIFPEKLIFEENEVRTTRINEVVRLISLNNNKLKHIKKGLNNSKIVQPSRVVMSGIEPPTQGFSVLCSTN